MQPSPAPASIPIPTPLPRPMTPAAVAASALADPKVAADEVADADVKQAVERAMALTSASRSSAILAGRDVWEQPSFVVVETGEDGDRIPQATNGKPLRSKSKSPLSRLHLRRHPAATSTELLSNEKAAKKPPGSPKMHKRGVTISRVGRFMRELGDAIRGRARVPADVLRVQREARIAEGYENGEGPYRTRTGSQSAPGLARSHSYGHAPTQHRHRGHHEQDATEAERLRAEYLANGPRRGLNKHRSRSLDFSQERKAVAAREYVSQRTTAAYQSVREQGTSSRGGYWDAFGVYHDASGSYPRHGHGHAYQANQWRDHSMPVQERIRAHQLAALDRAGYEGPEYRGTPYPQDGEPAYSHGSGSQPGYPPVGPQTLRQHRQHTCGRTAKPATAAGTAQSRNWLSMHPNLTGSLYDGHEGQ